MSPCALGSSFHPNIPARAWSLGTAFRFQRDWSCSGVRQRARVTEVQGKRRPHGFLSDKPQPRCKTGLRRVLTDPRPAVSWEGAHRVLPHCSHKGRGERPATASAAARAVDTNGPSTAPLCPGLLVKRNLSPDGERPRAFQVPCGSSRSKGMLRQFCSVKAEAPVQTRCGWRDRRFCLGGLFFFLL